MTSIFSRSLAIKVALLVLAGTSCVLAFVFVRGYNFSREYVVEEARENAQNFAQSQMLQMQQELRAVQETTQQFAEFLGPVPIDRQALLDLIRGRVEANEEIYGSTVSFEPFAFDPSVKEFGPYYWKGSKGIEYIDLADPSYEYPTRSWYRDTLERGECFWTEPYYDEGGGNVIMTTCTCPFYERNPDGTRGKAKGVVTSDVSLLWLTRELDGLKVPYGGFCFLVSRTGTFLAHPRKRHWIMNETLATVAERRKDPFLRAMADAFRTQDKGFLDVGTSLNAVESNLAFYRFPINGWTLGVVFPKTKLFAKTDELFHESLLLAAAATVFLLVVCVLVAGSVTGPLRRMVAATTRIAGGDLDVDLPDKKRNDEIGSLAAAFVRMAADLKKYIRDLTETTAAKERIESELSIAANIQRSMLPSTFPPFPDRTEFDIYACMQPAKMVGGDFYDFFLVDHDHLCIAIGDVSDKGVPAALFMSVTEYLMEAAAAEGASPDAILARLNRQLSRRNDTCMFVTIFCGILDLRIGELVFANGGHNSPMLLRPGHGVVRLAKPTGPLVGVIDNAAFTKDTLTMQPGDTLFAYTDGVTEAFSAAEEAFGVEKLQERLVALEFQPVKETIEQVMQSIADFTVGAPQSDDITMVAVRFHGEHGGRADESRGG